MDKKSENPAWKAGLQGRFRGKHNLVTNYTCKRDITKTLKRGITL